MVHSSSVVYYMTGKWQKLKNKVVTTRFAFKKVGSLIFQPKSLRLHSSSSTKRRESFHSKIHWRLNKKTKIVMVVLVTAVILISSFVLLYKPCGSKSDLTIIPQDNSTSTPNPSPSVTPPPQSIAPSPPDISSIIGPTNPLQPSKPKPPGLIESSPVINRTVWLQVAETAWSYFQPGVGVDPTTGLPYAGGSGFKAFTDWDLGVYIQSVIDAQEVGLINSTGAWGSYYRINKVLNFLETRPLNATTNYPFWFYDATNGTGYLVNTTYASDSVDVIDTGRLFVALHNLVLYNSSLTSRVDDIVLYGRSNYTALVPAIQNDASSNSIYAYFIDSGYASFWPNQIGYVPNDILRNIVNSPKVTTYGVSLPDTPISCDPLLCSVFELNTNDSALMSLMKQVYLAHEAYYNATGQYVAFSEGNGINTYVWEWVTNGTGGSWTITTSNGVPYSGYPIIFSKVAFSFLALYNTTYARNTVIYLEKVLPTPVNGYSNGADNYGDLSAGVGSNTNGLILDAAWYALNVTS